MKNLRIYIDKEKHETYEKLVKRGSDNPDHYPFQTMKDLFMLSACLGYKHSAYEDIGSSKDIFSADVFDEKADIPMLIALAYAKEKKLMNLLNGRKVLDIAQGYANGGIGYVVEEIINNPGKPLNNLVEMILIN